MRTNDIGQQVTPKLQIGDIVKYSEKFFNNRGGSIDNPAYTNDRGIIIDIEPVDNHRSYPITTFFYNYFVADGWWRSTITYFNHRDLEKLKL